jgi:cytochrome c biogenesis protein CcmG, thiol:disulfide interchange protein DsbE
MTDRPRRRLRLYMVPLIGVCLLFLASDVWHGLPLFAPAQEPGTTVGREAPEFSLLALDGAPIRLSDLRGQVVLLNFWATWCPGCRQEMRDLNDLYQENAGHGFVVLGVNVEETHLAVRDFVSVFGISFPMVLDPNGVVSIVRYRVGQLPASFIVDREGQIRDAWTGRLGGEEMRKRLAKVW